MQAWDILTVVAGALATLASVVSMVENDSLVCNDSVSTVCCENHHAELEIATIGLLSTVTMAVFAGLRWLVAPALHGFRSLARAVHHSPDVEAAHRQLDNAVNSQWPDDSTWNLMRLRVLSAVQVCGMAAWIYGLSFISGAYFETVRYDCPDTCGNTTEPACYKPPRNPTIYWVITVALVGFAVATLAIAWFVTVGFSKRSLKDVHNRSNADPSDTGWTAAAVKLARFAKGDGLNHTLGRFVDAWLEHYMYSPSITSV